MLVNRYEREYERERIKRRNLTKLFIPGQELSLPGHGSPQPQLASSRALRGILRADKRGIRRSSHARSPSTSLRAGSHPAEVRGFSG